jgi:CheY-like chemotaxis protein
VTAASYEQALDQLKKPQQPAFDIAILDHHMPVRSGADLAQAMRADSQTATLPIIFLSSGNLNVLRERTKALDISIFINKPIKKDELINAISTATSPSIQSPPQPVPVLQKAQEVREHFPMRVAIAEDNLINRMVMEKMIGPLVDELVFWEDGQIAVCEYETWAPDFVFMDVSMPVLDGLAATQKIRQSEAANGTKQIPIYALTANAMAEDEARCIAAGMTGYLSKPVVKADILKILAEHSKP